MQIYLHISKKSATFAALFKFNILQIMNNSQLSLLQKGYKNRATFNLIHGVYLTQSINGRFYSLADFLRGYENNALLAYLIQSDDFSYLLYADLKIRKYCGQIIIFYGKNEYR